MAAPAPVAVLKGAPTARGRVRERLDARGAYSWRGDAAVPAFHEDRPLILFDGVCVLCSRFARFVAKRDGGCFRFVAAQSRLGQALMRHYNLDVGDFETNLLLADGRAYGKLDAATLILRRLGPGWRCAANLASMLPGSLADWMYDRVAHNRYAVFGRYDVCVRPGPEWRDRVLDGE